MKALFDDPCLGAGVHFVDHGDGCIHSGVCNGSCPTGSGVELPTLAVLREPCDHFLSVVGHLARVAPDIVPPPHEATFDEAFDIVMASLRRSRVTCGAGPRADPHCFTRFIDSQSSILGSDRVLLYPQAFFVNGATMDAVCYADKRTDVLFDILSALGKGAGCPAPSRADFPETPKCCSNNAGDHPPTLSEPQCAEVRRLYNADVVLWNMKCKKA